MKTHLLPVNSTVRHSDDALRSLRDLMLGTGQPQRRSGYRQELERKQAMRGTVTAVLESKYGSNFYEITWDNGTLSQCQTYMVSPA